VLNGCKSMNSRFGDKVAMAKIYAVLLLQIPKGTF
jgi:hypothetical protein